MQCGKKKYIKFYVFTGVTQQKKPCLSYFLLFSFLKGKDAKKSVMLSEDSSPLLENEAAVIYRENVAKKYANFFQSTLHHNNGYFLQVVLQGGQSHVLGMLF